MSNEDGKNLNVNVSFGHRSDSEESHRPIARRVVRFLGISVIVLITAVALIYALIPNRIDEFTYYTVSSSDGTPGELRHRLRQDQFEVVITKPETGTVTTAREIGSQQIAYFNQATETLVYWGHTYEGRRAAKASGDIARSDDTVTLSEIRTTKGLTYYPRKLTRQELVWLMYRPEDMRFLHFSEFTTLRRTAAQ